MFLCVGDEHEHIREERGLKGWEGINREGFIYEYM